MAKAKLAAAVHGLLNLIAAAVETGSSLLGQKLDRAQSRPDNQREHDGILNGSWSVFALQETK
jgi:hypothetical protein